MKPPHEILTREFCEKRIVEQDDYLNELYDRKNTMTIERYIELMQCAVQRKDYFYKILIKYYGTVLSRR